MKVLFDTNVLIDLLMNRPEWVAEAQAVWLAHDAGRIEGYVVASTLTDIFYIARKQADIPTARVAVRKCLQTFFICPVDRAILEAAELLPGSDFEDNVQLVCAQLWGVDAIVTRDKKGFAGATLPVLSPAALLTQLP